MGTNRELLKQLRTGRSMFYLTDLHVHSPASFDVRRGKRLAALSEHIRIQIEAIPDSLADDPPRFEEEVTKLVPPDQFLKELVTQRNTVSGELEPDSGADWGVLAITDHNVCGYSCALASLAFEKRAEYKLLVLPGIELDIVYPCEGVSGSAQVHVLCLFRPGTTDHDIRSAVRDAAGKTWKYGASLEVASLPSFVQGVRNHAEWPAICIAAHVSSGRGVQRETKRTILNHVEAELSRLEGEKDSGREPDLKSLELQIATMKGLRDPDRIAIEVLRLIGQCGFDALQVSSTEDAVHYRRLHRFREGHGRACPIVASDAHTPLSVFKASTYYPRLKLPAISASLSADEVFGRIRRALRYGETRFSATAQASAQYWIAGIQIERDTPTASRFWPAGIASSGAPSTPFVLPLSRNLNTLIGGRGSGKSATIEAIAFVTDADSFAAEGRKRANERAEHYGRADATLAGCRVKLAWQFSGDSGSDLPKRALFEERYFDPAHKHGPVKPTNADDQALVPNQVPPHPVQIFRLAEIEKQAGADRLRALFDQICGPNVEVLAKAIADKILELQNQRAKCVEIAGRIKALSRDGSPLRTYAERKRLYEKVNTKEMKETYEKIDALETAATAADKALTLWNQALSSSALDTIDTDVSSFCSSVRQLVFNAEGGIHPHLEDIAALFPLPPGSSDSEHAVAAATKSLRDTSDVSAKGIKSAGEKIARTLLEAKSELEAKGLPLGSADRDAKRRAFGEAEQSLKDYQSAIAEWSAAIDRRNTERAVLLKLCEDRSALRCQTAQMITARLAADLDSSVIKIEADAHVSMDRKQFSDWMHANFRAPGFMHYQERIDALIESGLAPDTLRAILFSEAGALPKALEVNKGAAADGAIFPDVAEKLAEKCRVISTLPPEIDPASTTTEEIEGLPKEIRDGLITFHGEPQQQAEQALRLDEVTSDDTPQITLNDRPTDPKARARPVEQLSPGQRCSAVLPILLLTGTAPLIIDQPEDNLDNRLIRQVIVNILASIKLRRQVIVATHNPNLPVLGDVEAAVILRGVGEKECEVVKQGDLDSDELSHHLTEVMEGGREAFQYRHVIYSAHWQGPVVEKAPPGI